MGADVGSSVSGVIPYTAWDHEDTRTNTAVFKMRRATAPGLKSQVPNSYGVNQAIGGYLNLRRETNTPQPGTAEPGAAHQWRPRL